MPPEKPLPRLRLLVQGRPPVCNPALRVKLTIPQHTGCLDAALSPPEDSPNKEGSAVQMEGGAVNGDEHDLSDGEDGLGKMFYRQEEGNLVEYEDENQLLAFEQYWDSEGEEELSEAEGDIRYQIMNLEMEQEEVSEAESDDNDDSDTDSGQDNDDYDHNYVPDMIPRDSGCAGMSKRSTLSKKVNTKITPKQAAKDRRTQRSEPKRPLSYEFCPLAHRLSILRLLSKHFCLHPLLPERHGKARDSEQIHYDSVYEMYLHCKRNHLREVWAYLWTNWYTADKWRLWARSEYPHAIPRKRTTMVVEAMWRNLKRLALHLHNRPRVDFATYALVTEVLPAYRNKLIRICCDPREGRAPTLNGEQASIRGAWLTLFDREIIGHYDTDKLTWTCSCGSQKYSTYLLCKHLVQDLPRPHADWWATVVRHHVPPFYDVRDLLSPEDRARAPQPEELRNYAWLRRMNGGDFDSNAPDLSSLPVCFIYF